MKKQEAPQNKKGNKPISPANNTKVKMSHEMAAGKFTQPRGAANSQSGAHQSKAVRGAKKK